METAIRHPIPVQPRDVFPRVHPSFDHVRSSIQSTVSHTTCITEVTTVSTKSSRASKASHAGSVFQKRLKKKKRPPINLSEFLTLEDQMRSNPNVETLQQIVVNYNNNAVKLLNNEGEVLCKALLFKAEDLLLEYNNSVDIEKSEEAIFNYLLSITYNNLCLYFNKCNDWHTALTYGERCLDVDLKREQHSDIANSYLNNCTLLSKINKHKKAIQYVREAIRHIEYEEQVGTSGSALPSRDHEIVDGNSADYLKCVALHNLAYELDVTGEFMNAKTAINQAFALAKKCFGPTHSITIQMQNTLQMMVNRTLQVPSHKPQKAGKNVVLTKKEFRLPPMRVPTINILEATAPNTARPLPNEGPRVERTSFSARGPESRPIFNRASSIAPQSPTFEDVPMGPIVIPHIPVPRMGEPKKSTEIEIVDERGQVSIGEDGQSELNMSKKGKKKSKRNSHNRETTEREEELPYQSRGRNHIPFELNESLLWSQNASVSLSDSTLLLAEPPL